MTRPVFGQLPCRACKGTGSMYGAACGSCKGTGVDVPRPPLPDPKPEVELPPTPTESTRQRPPSVTTGGAGDPTPDTQPRENREDCQRAHSNVAIAAYHLSANGELSAYDSVYETRCPWCAFTRRNTRLAATIHTLRHDYGWDIETAKVDGQLATYRMA